MTATQNGPEKTPENAPTLPGPIAHDGQRRAADPAASVWVSASAGAGKTKVLVDRALRLLLAGTEPHRILCLTYTRAAAAEMALRINRQLGDWSVMNDEALLKDLSALTGQEPDPDTVATARRLFANVLESVDGIRILTLHAFCESILGRFPLESDVVPNFDILDERSQSEVMVHARDEVLAAARRDPGGKLADAVDFATAATIEESFTELMVDFAAQRRRLTEFLLIHGGIDGAEQAIDAALGVSDGENEQALAQAFAADGAFDRDGLTRLAAALAKGAKTDQARAPVIGEWLAASADERADTIERYRLAFLTANLTPRARAGTKAAMEAMPDLQEVFDLEVDRLLEHLERWQTLQVAVASSAVLRIADRMIRDYERLKADRAVLDYDDLILKTRALLETGGGPSWVHYKLDGGIDHILIDESQDTNRDQWAVVDALSAEFFAGIGVREDTEDRTVFAVGDPKQSIYSFQGADPTAFADKQADYQNRVTAAARRWEPVALDRSFRSTDAVLQAVDAVFASDAARDGLGVDRVNHTLHRTGQAGEVELWPAVYPPEPPPPEPWLLPTIQPVQADPQARLAGAVAQRIKSLIDGPARLESRGRGFRPGDFLILVRRRTAFVNFLVRELKGANVPVAGIDRMKLADQLAVQDMLALADFLLLPEDDLTLAIVLKGPLVGLDEEALFDLAYDRGERSLWSRLVAVRDDPRYADAHGFLGDLLARVDFEPPFDLLAGILSSGEDSGRSRIVERLGSEANEPLDELLALALTYGRQHAPSLQGFLDWFRRGAGEIKRDPEEGRRDEVRIMTVHGAKGLQAPVVFLADTLQTPVQVPRLHWWPQPEGPDLPLWSPRKATENEVYRSVKEDAVAARDREYRRLLYVAMTRAEDRLIVAGFGGRRAPRDDCWHNLVAAGLESLPEAECRDDMAIENGEDGWSGTGYILRTVQRAAPDRQPDPEVLSVRLDPLPAWARVPAPDIPVPPRPLAPSKPDEEEPAAPSPFADAGPDRFRRGILIHRLLEMLPPLSPDRREAAGAAFLARATHALEPATQSDILQETLAVMADPGAADIFGPAARAEAPVAGVVDGRVISGQIDRLVVTDEAVRIVDFKSNRPPPVHPAQISSVYARQLAAYQALLRPIYPDIPITCEILWTAVPRLMTVPENLLSGAAG